MCRILPDNSLLFLVIGFVVVSFALRVIAIVRKLKKERGGYSFFWIRYEFQNIEKYGYFAVWKIALLVLIGSVLLAIDYYCH